MRSGPRSRIRLRRWRTPRHLPRLRSRRPEIRPDPELRSRSCQRPCRRTTRTFESRGIGETAAGEGVVALTCAVAGFEVSPRRSVATYWNESGPEEPAAGV